MSDERYELPEGWSWTRIGDVVVDAQPGFASGRKGIEGGIRHLRMNNIGPNCMLDLSQVTTVPADLARERHLLRPGDVLFCHTNSQKLVGKTALFNLDDELYAFSNHLTRLRLPADGPPPQWLWYFLATLWRDRYFETRCKQWVNQATIERDTLLSTAVPMAPLAEQRRIVAKIKVLFEQSRTARQALDRIPPLLKKFRQAVLAAAFRGDLTRDWREQNRHAEPAQRSVASLIGALPRVKTRRDVPASVERPEEFERIELPSTWAIESTAALLRAGALIDVKDGNHGSNHPKRNEFSETGLAFITAAQVRNYQIDYISSPKVAGEALKRLRVGFANVGDVILTHKGTVGRAAINTEPCVLTPQTTYYRCNREVIDPQYLVYYLTSAHFFRQLAAVMSQTTRNFVPISEQYRLFMIVPPLTEQEEIIHRLTMMFTLADATEAAVEAARRRADKVDQSILARAFHGELVPQDPNDEPASALLERVHSERSIGTPPRRLAGDQARKRKRAGKKPEV